LQNRLEFTISTLAIQEENASASESAIRDADISRETIRFTRNQILVSAGTSVLAQANLVPQTALQLLGG
jgi:flagellin